ncbi:hypothetical protein Btru_010919 [Bulinus truncatus]|nr:hypothetical protein Btru_010919 [Bulinus truncatus]
MMGSYFDTTVSLNDILFQYWSTSTAGGVILASFLSCFFTVLFEGLKTLKSFVIILRKHNPWTSEAIIANRAVQISESQADLLSSSTNAMSGSKLRKWRKILFTVESVLNLVSFFYGYLLMLLVMTYSVWLLLAVLLGTGMGYFIFHPISEHLVTKYTPRPAQVKTTGCCSEEDDSESAQQHRENSRLLQSSVRNYQGI